MVSTNKIGRLHGVLGSVVSDRDPRFTYRFWSMLQKALGTRLNFSTAYHPQTDGQSERTIQTLELMLRACALEFPESWDEHLPLVEFTYNNNYHSSIKAAPYEALYGRKGRMPLCWDEVGEQKVHGSELVDSTKEKVEVIRDRLKAAQDRQKSYADNRRRELEFEVGDFVFLKILPWKGVIRFKRGGKLNPRYIGPFEVIGKVGPVAYCLQLLPEMEIVHNVFHVSMLRKYISDPSHVLDTPPVELTEDMSFKTQPVAILDREINKLRSKEVPVVKMLWRS